MATFESVFDKEKKFDLFSERLNQTQIDMTIKKEVAFKSLCLQEITKIDPTVSLWGSVENLVADGRIATEAIPNTGDRRYYYLGKDGEPRYLFTEINKVGFEFDQEKLIHKTTLTTTFIKEE